MQEEHTNFMETWEILNATSECPYGKCDGTGMIQARNKKTFEVAGFICKCRQQNIYSQRVQFANIPKEFSELTVASFETELYSKEVDKELARNAKRISVGYVKDYEKYEDRSKGLYFYSKTKGSGKTRLAVSLGNALLNVKHKQVKFITTVDILKEIRNTYNKETKYTESQVIEGIAGVEILIVDDIGVERAKNWINEVLYSIFDTRMKYKRVTIFTSNCSIESLEHDERLKSRIFKMAIPVKMPEEDIRIKQSKEENEKLQNDLLGVVNNEKKHRRLDRCTDKGSR